MGARGCVSRESPPTPRRPALWLGCADAWCALGESSCGWRRGPGRTPQTPRTVDRAGIVPAGALRSWARFSWGSGLVWHTAGARKSVTEPTHKRLLMFDIKSGASPHPWASQLPSEGGGDPASWPGAQAGGLLPGARAALRGEGRQGCSPQRAHQVPGCTGDRPPL